MNYEERANIIEKSQSKKINDAEIFFPEAMIYKLSDREYKIYPLKLKQMRLLLKVSKINMSQSMSEDDLNLIIDTISEIIGEKEKEFIEKNVDVEKIMELFQKIEIANSKGIPPLKRTDSPG